jgi:hypothetical protein
MRWYLLFLLLLLPIAAAHDEGPPHEEPAPASCMPTDTVKLEYDWLIGTLIIIGALLLATRVLLPRTLAFVFIICALLLFAGALWLSYLVLEINPQSAAFGRPGSTHLHADFQIMLNNQLVDLSNEYYFTYPEHTRSRFVHLHEPNYVVHVHATNVTWQYFFETLNLTMDGDCMSVRGVPLCDATFIVNGQEITTLNTPIRDGDQALFHYGAGNASLLFAQAVGNESCLYSGTCPERGIVTGCTS